MELFSKTESQELVKKYFYRFVKILIIFSIVGATWDYFAIKNPQTAFGHLGFCLFLSLIFLFEKFEYEFVFIKQYLYSCMYVLLFYIAIFTGGLSAPMISWFYIIIVMNGKLNSKKSQYVWVSLISLGFISLGVLEKTKTLSDSIVQVNIVEDTLMALLFLIAVLLFFEKMSSELNLLIKKQRDEINQMNVNRSKLESLGVMASSMAHEINNPLAIIGGYVKIIETCIQRKTYSELNGISGKMIAQVQKMDYLIRNLKKYSRDGGLAPQKRENLSKMIDEVLDLYNTRMENLGINIIVKVDPYIELNCRQIEMGQVLINLLNNSIDAIKDFHNRWISITAHVENDYCVIFFKDSGYGISSEAREKLFTPFFTTKDVGEGTGLGLSISKSIIKNHNGSLEYIEDEHTTFKIVLPLDTQRIES